MKNSIGLIGDITGGAGVLICVVGGFARLAQTWYVGGVSVPAMFQLGTALMVAGCLAKLHVVTGSKL
jgi:hypothetical protein